MVFNAARLLSPLLLGSIYAIFAERGHPELLFLVAGVSLQLSHLDDIANDLGPVCGGCSSACSASLPWTQSYAAVAELWARREPGSRQDTSTCYIIRYIYCITCKHHLENYTALPPGVVDSGESPPSLLNLFSIVC